MDDGVLERISGVEGAVEALISKGSLDYSDGEAYRIIDDPVNLTVLQAVAGGRGITLKRSELDMSYMAVALDQNSPYAVPSTRVRETMKNYLHVSNASDGTETVERKLAWSGLIIFVFLHELFDVEGGFDLLTLSQIRELVTERAGALERSHASDASAPAIVGIAAGFRALPPEGESAAERSSQLGVVAATMGALSELGFVTVSDAGVTPTPRLRALGPDCILAMYRLDALRELVERDGDERGEYHG